MSKLLGIVVSRSIKLAPVFSLAGHIVFVRNLKRLHHRIRLPARFGIECENEPLMNRTDRL